MEPFVAHLWLTKSQNFWLYKIKYHAIFYTISQEIIRQDVPTAIKQRLS